MSLNSWKGMWRGNIKCWWVQRATGALSLHVTASLCTAEERHEWNKLHNGCKTGREVLNALLHTFFVEKDKNSPLVKQWLRFPLKSAMDNTLQRASLCVCCWLSTWGLLTSKYLQSTVPLPLRREPGHPDSSRPAWLQVHRVAEGLKFVFYWPHRDLNSPNFQDHSQNVEFCLDLDPVCWWFLLRCENVCMEQLCTDSNAQVRC